MKKIEPHADEPHEVLWKKFADQKEFGITGMLEQAVIYHEGYSTLPTDEFVRFCDLAGLDEAHHIFLESIGDRLSQLRSAVGSHMGAVALLDMVIKRDPAYFDMMLMVGTNWAEADSSELRDSLVTVIISSAAGRFAN